MLVLSHVSGFKSAAIQELHLQAKYLGYEADEAVLIASDSSGQLRKQLWSVKHNARFTPEALPGMKDDEVDALLLSNWQPVGQSTASAQMTG